MGVSDRIPTNMLKYCSALQNKSFPNKLKPGDITPIFRKYWQESIFFLFNFERIWNTNAKPNC